jgi:hypothetical protein
MVTIGGGEAGKSFYLLQEDVMEIYTSHFHTVSTNSLYAAPDLVFNTPDVTNCSFAHTIMVSECNITLSCPTYPTPPLSPTKISRFFSFYSWGSSIIQTIQTQVQQSITETAINTVNVHFVE